MLLTLLLRTVVVNGGSGGGGDDGVTLFTKCSMGMIHIYNFHSLKSFGESFLRKLKKGI